jgi:hypothetical protein
LQCFALLVLPTTEPIILQKLYLNLHIAITVVNSWDSDFSLPVMPMLSLIPYHLPKPTFTSSLHILTAFAFFFEGEMSIPVRFAVR